MNRERRSNTAQGIHVVAKPIGPMCNLNCEYCFYLEKHALFGAGEKYRMFDKVLSAFITNYIKSQPTPLVEFVWQGVRGVGSLPGRMSQTPFCNDVLQGTRASLSM